MSLPKPKAREIVLLLLYSREMAPILEEELTDLVMDIVKVSKKAVEDAGTRVKNIVEKLPEIDACLQRISKGYTLERIYKLEKNVLRLGAYELLFDEEIPPKVAIHEAMRLARKFSTKEAANFVNAVLDNLYKEKCGEEIDLDAIQEKAKQLLEDKNDHVQ